MTPTDETAHGRPGNHTFEVLIAGGGVAGLEGAFALREFAGDHVSVTLLSPTDEFVYRPMAVAEPFSREGAHTYPLAPLAEQADVKLVLEALIAVDPGRHVATTASGDEIAYDALLVCVGTSLYAPFSHATTVNDARMDELLRGLVQDVEEGYVKRLAIVIPAPMPWPMPAYELALMTADRAWDMQTEIQVTVLTPEDSPLSLFGREASLELSRLLAERGIDVITSAYCEVPKAKTVRIHPGDRTLEYDRILAMPALRGPALRGLPQDGGGFIPVDEYGRVRDTDRVWAAGDATDTPIKQGGVAAQLADTAAQSIAALAGAGSEPEPFEPVVEGVLLTGGTPRRMRGRPTGGHGADSEMTTIDASEVPPKISARYLTPHLDPAPSA